MDEVTPLLSANYNIQSSSTTSFRASSEIDHIEEPRFQLKKPGITRTLAFAIAACILGSSFQLGFNTGVVNSPEAVIIEFYNETHVQREGTPLSSGLLNLLWAITVSSYPFGGMLGGVTAGLWANKYGRRGALLRNNSTAIVAAALLGFAKLTRSYEMLIAGRFISGINAGISSGVGPLYLAEIAPISLRGLVGTFNQLAITLGVLVAQIIGLGIALGTERLWPLCVGFTIVPVIYQLSTLTWCPESPRFLMLTLHEDDEAEKALVWLRGTEDIGEELEEIRIEKVEQRNAVKFSVVDLFKNVELRWPLIISVVLQLAQQFSGINAVIYYSTSIFEEANLSEAASQYATVGVGLVNVIMTFFSALLMDKLGRRVLMITGLAGLFVFSSVLVIALVFQPQVSWLSYVCIVAVVLYIIFFATGPGAIPWFYVAELFAEGPRTAAVSISVLVNWFANFIVGVIFPQLQSSLGVYSFLPFVVMLLCFLIFTVAFVPETKGKRIEDITLLFKASESQESSKTDLTYRQISEDPSSSVQASSYTSTINWTLQ